MSGELSTWQYAKYRVMQRINSFVANAILSVQSSALYDRFLSWFEPRNIFTTRQSNTLATNETIFAAVSRLSNSMGSLPLKQYGRDFQVINTPISDLLINGPNPNMTGVDFIRTLEAHKNTSGNGYAIKDYDIHYQVKALWVLDPGKVTPVIESTTKELWYEIDGEKGRYYVHNMDIIHVKHIHTIGYKGISPIDVLRNTIDFDGKVKEFSLDQLDGAVKASFILKMAAHLGDEKKAQILANFRSFYRENGGVLIQEQGTTIEAIERKFLDANVFEVERITRTRVAMVYNLPVSMLGETEGVNYNSQEQMSLEYAQYTLTPSIRQYEAEFNKKLLTTDQRLRQGIYFKFNLNALLRGDTKTRSEFYFRGVRTGYLSPNEVRAWEELPPKAGGEKLYMSKDLSPINEREEVNTP